MEQAERYVLRGLDIPVIAPGKLEHLQKFIKTAYESSKLFPDRLFRVESVTGKERVILRRYKAGEDITDYELGQFSCPKPEHSEHRQPDFPRQQAAVHMQAKVIREMCGKPVRTCLPGLGA